MEMCHSVFFPTVACLDLIALLAFLACLTRFARLVRIDLRPLSSNITTLCVLYGSLLRQGRWNVSININNFWSCGTTNPVGFATSPTLLIIGREEHRFHQVERHLVPHLRTLTHKETPSQSDLLGENHHHVEEHFWNGNEAPLDVLHSSKW